MRVARTTTNAKAGGARRSGGGGDGRGFEPAARAETGAAAVAGGGVLGSIDALTALQGVGGADAAASAAAATARGTALLDDLDALRDELLAGAVDDATLGRLRDRLGERRRGRLDAGLEAVLDDIELRAAVELAKREPAAPPSSAAPAPAADGGPAPADTAARARRAYGVGGGG